jgi:hypothetical protein
MRKKLKAKAVKPTCPPHYWIIDEKNVGRCNKPGYGCGAVRDFGKELLKKALEKPYYNPRYTPEQRE